MRNRQKAEFLAGVDNCRFLILEKGESYCREFYGEKVEYSRKNGGSKPLVKAYWDGYYFVLSQLGFAVERV